MTRGQEKRDRLREWLMFSVGSFIGSVYGSLMTHWLQSR